MVGLEVGGAVKNVIALAAGMCEGLDLGTNAVTALVTRGLYEMQRIALAMGGRASTIMGLSGVGDTFGTCFGPLSRNRNTGMRLGRGEKLDDILHDMGQVAEGVDTAFALERLIKKSHKSYRVIPRLCIILQLAVLIGDGRRKCCPSCGSNWKPAQVSTLNSQSSSGLLRSSEETAHLLRASTRS